MIRAALLALLLSTATGSWKKAGLLAQDTLDWRSIATIEQDDRRVSAYCQALANVNAAELGQLLQPAFNEFMTQNQAFQLEPAQALAEAMHSRARATWSAMSLALVSTRAGASDRAEEVLREQLAGTLEGPDKIALLERLGLALQGAGFERRALGPLGSSFARGSRDAGVVLGRIALRQGRLDHARAIFRSLLDEEPSPSWALRGWGLSMLPTRSY
ncbi:MAG: tetratricopeptide (TPR) repeat protein [Planctomycetota bacterium]